MVLRPRHCCINQAFLGTTSISVSAWRGFRAYIQYDQTPLLFTQCMNKLYLLCRWGLFWKAHEPFFKYSSYLKNAVMKRGTERVGVIILLQYTYTSVQYTFKLRHTFFLSCQFQIIILVEYIELMFSLQIRNSEET